MIKKFLTTIFFVISTICAYTQELEARVMINADRVGSKVDKKIFQTLQQALNSFLNNQKWTRENFQTNEKINCQFLLNISDQISENVYKASLSVQAARPIYNTSYESPLVNFIDEQVTFRYIEFQPLAFNENRISGSEPLSANLTAILAFYVNLILGMDYDSFSLNTGTLYFNKMQNIVNNAPEGSDIVGWKAFDGMRNRYWMMDNLTNPKYKDIREAFFTYYRLGLDKMYDKEPEARASILAALLKLEAFHAEFNNTMILPLFLQGKQRELIGIYKKATPELKNKARDILMKIDVTNANTYKQELK
ncbi:type IX secretion system protein PorD [Gynurincola endophyticus]|uniref:type IX secretion system protein PorD n=1 Tax=Gynurincola endophyticus TaxID=2479004 RepID=UPI000F8D5C05|nr:DUF4835 family protein [Gynurincola endophyticus]